MTNDRPFEEMSEGVAAVVRMDVGHERPGHDDGRERVHRVDGSRHAGIMSIGSSNSKGMGLHVEGRRGAGRERAG